MDSILLELFFIAILIIANGFFACSEFAIISIRKSRIGQLVAAGDERAKIAEELQKDPNRLLAVVQIGVTIIGSTASAVGGVIAVKDLKPVLQNAPWEWVRHGAEPFSITIVVALISYLILIIGELVPKTLGLQFADTLALHVAKPINFLSRLGALGVIFLTASSKAVLAIFRIKMETRPFITREEIQHIVAEGHESGIFSEEEQEYIQNIFDFTHTTVREVMVPRTRMAALDIELPADQMLLFILDNQYSRYPVYRGNLENTIGFVHGKDILGGIVKDPNFDITTVIRPPFYVPEGKKVNDLLKEIQRKRTHMALVVDEYGGISGLVTTEDLLEELVGEIEDEHDVGDPHRIEELPDGSLLVDALMSIYDLDDKLGIGIHEDEDLPFDTVAGLILHELGHFPRKGERIEWRGYRFISVEVRQTSVVKVKVEKIEEEGEGEKGD